MVDARMLAPEARTYTREWIDGVPTWPEAAQVFRATDTIRFGYTIAGQINVGDEYFVRLTAPDGTHYDYPTYQIEEHEVQDRVES